MHLNNLGKKKLKIKKKILHDTLEISRLHLFKLGTRPTIRPSGHVIPEFF